MYYLKGYDAAKLKVELEIPRVRPGGKIIDSFPFIYWKDATEEQKNTLCWIESAFGKRALRKYTQEEKEEIRLNHIFRIEETYKKLLTKYGWEYAEKYKETQQGKEGITFNSAYPRCKYSLDNQCNLFCYYFKEGKCSYYEN